MFNNFSYQNIFLLSSKFYKKLASCIILHAFRAIHLMNFIIFPV